MDHVLTEHGLRLTYLRDPNVIDNLDQDQILDDLSDGTPRCDPLPWLPRYGLANYDHLFWSPIEPIAAIWHFWPPTMGPLLRRLPVPGNRLRDRRLPVARKSHAENDRSRHAAHRRHGSSAVSRSHLHSPPGLLPDHAGRCATFCRCDALPDPDSAGSIFAPPHSRSALSVRSIPTIASRPAPAPSSARPSEAVARSYRPTRRSTVCLASISNRPTGLAVLGSRDRDEAAILDDARQIYRSRLDSADCSGSDGKRFTQ